MRYHRYGHLKDVFVKVGQKIRRGDVIGTLGSTGNSQSSHLHYDVFKVKPAQWTSYVIGKSKQYVTDNYEDPYQFVDKSRNIPSKFDHLGYNWLEKAKYGSGLAFHPGIDINGPGIGNSDMGQEVYASVDCEVVHVSNDDSYNAGWGNMIVIRELTKEEKVVEDSPVAAQDMPGSVSVPVAEVTLQPVFSWKQTASHLIRKYVEKSLFGVFTALGLAGTTGLDDAVVLAAGFITTGLLVLLEYLSKAAVQKYNVMSNK